MEEDKIISICKDCVIIGLQSKNKLEAQKKFNEYLKLKGFKNGRELRPREK